MIFGYCLKELQLNHPTSRIWRILRWGGIVVSAGICALCVLIVQYQEQLIFPYYSESSQKPVEERVEPLSVGVERILIGEKGNQIEAWIKRPITQPKGVALVFRANLGLLVDHVSLIEWAADHGYVAAVFNYPGMGLSEGFPSEQSILDAGEVVFKQLKDTLLAPTGRIWIIGYSIGTGPAGIFAAKHAPDLLTLFAPYTDLQDVVKSRTLFWPFAPFLRFRFPLQEPISSLRHTDFIVATGGADRTVLPEISARVFKLYKGDGRKIRIHNPTGEHDRLLGANRLQLDEALTILGY